MTRALAAWLCLLVVFVAGVAATYVACPGCIDRTRVNPRCEWHGGGTLAADAQLAEELAIRYADGEFARRSGFDAHGGLLEGGAVRRACMARLVGAIEREHAATDDQIQAARGERNPTFDAAVAVLFVPIYIALAVVACRRIRRRFPDDVPSVHLAATALVSLAAGVAAIQLGQFWLGVWEVVRVGNGHISVFRAASRTHWTHRYVSALLAASVLLFWAVSLAMRYTEGSCQRQFSVRKWRNGRRASLRS